MRVFVLDPAVTDDLAYRPSPSENDDARLYELDSFGRLSFVLRGNEHYLRAALERDHTRVYGWLYATDTSEAVRRWARYATGRRSAPSNIEGRAA